MKNYRALAVILVALLFASNVFPAFSQPAESLPPGSKVQEVRALTAISDPQGTLWAAWEADSGTDGEIYYSLARNGRWATPQPARVRPDAWDRNPSLAVAGDGSAWLVWVSAAKQEPDRHEILVSRWTGHEWGEPATVPLAGVTSLAEIAAAGAPDGTLWLAWSGFDGVDHEIFASHWDGISWSAVQQVSTDDQEAGLYDRQPQLAVGQDGLPWLVWTGHQGKLDDEILSSHWTGARWTQEQLVNADDEALDIWPSLALDSKGQPWVAWTGRVPVSDGMAYRILISHWDASLGTWTPEEIVPSPFGPDVDERYPSLAIDQADGVVLSWSLRGAGGPALAHTRQVAGRWDSPRLIRAGEVTDHVLSVTTDGSAQFLWLGSSPDRAVPLDSAKAADSTTELQSWMAETETEVQPQVAPIANRFLAFGDSITWGQYPVEDPFHPYPAGLEDILDARVMASEVINVGLSGERVGTGINRIGGEVSNYIPQYVLFMEGTNDVTAYRTPAEVKQDLLIIIDIVRKYVGVEHIKLMFATLIPRLDSLNSATYTMNQEAIISAAGQKGLPVCDQWQAFYDYTDDHGLPLSAIYFRDPVHPNQEGLDLLATTFFGCLQTSYWWLADETTPPVTWIDSLPAESKCGQVDVSWTGTDNLSWVTDYDVQVSTNGGPWTDWLLGTAQTNGTYLNVNYGDVIGFRVRGRDVAGNQSDWSAPAYSTVSQAEPPIAFVNPLPPAQLAPFAVSWGGTDQCADVVGYAVQYRVGLAGTWTTWQSYTAATSIPFDVPPLQYGETYYFQAKAVNEASIWSTWSPAQSTLLAQFGVGGQIYNTRHEPVIGAQVDVDPVPPYIASVLGGGFLAYVVTPGNYDVSVARLDRFGELPTMWNLPVDDDVSDLVFVLPPQDDVVTDGGFEYGDLSAWQVSGTPVPTRTVNAHTGTGTVLLGGGTGSSTLSQVLSVPPSLTNPTLSFMVRLDDGSGGNSTLQVSLAGVPVSTQTVTSGLWTHVWVPIEGFLGQSGALTFSVSNSPAILLDEVSLGSALPGGSISYLPAISRTAGQ
ncbi:MAG: GDSL-type esterase/lipase family protein [Anaerolineae bacterium]|jgi:lysophospholipase L1-like esterase